MKKNQFEKKIKSLLLLEKREKKEKITKIIEKFEKRISGKKGAEDARDRMYLMLKNFLFKKETRTLTKEYREKRFKEEEATRLASLANLKSDEHGTYKPGDYVFVIGEDFVGPWMSAKAPYWDMGGEGLGLVKVNRKRVYSRTSNWKPSYATTKFLVGKNESGTYFTHPVSQNCKTVEDAVQWIWNGKAYDIIQRQGDIALIRGIGLKIPKLPSGHNIKENFIYHETHPPLPIPKTGAKTGERIIIGRRAFERATKATRD